MIFEPLTKTDGITTLLGLLVGVGFFVYFGKLISWMALVVCLVSGAVGVIFYRMRCLWVGTTIAITILSDFLLAVVHGSKMAWSHRGSLRERPA